MAANSATDKRPAGNLNLIVNFLKKWIELFYSTSKENSDFKFFSKVFLTQILTALTTGGKSFAEIPILQFEFTKQLAKKTFKKHEKTETLQLTDEQLEQIIACQQEMQEFVDKYQWTPGFQKFAEFLLAVLNDGAENKVGLCYAANVHAKNIKHVSVKRKTLEPELVES